MLPTVFVSFDYADDKHYKYLLEAWNKNPKFRFTFDDGTPEEIDSYNVGRIKAALTLKIKDATHILVIVGQNANKTHSKRSLIGYKNWINFEIAKAKELGKRIAVVKLDSRYELPDELAGVPTATVHSFTEQNIISVLSQAPFPGLIRRYVH
jgi:hypothetical protein